jgi:hypothetical protein
MWQLASQVKELQPVSFCARHLTEASTIPSSNDVLTSEGSWEKKFLSHARQTRPMAPAGLSVSQRTGCHSAGISCTTHELFCPYVVLYGTWSETSPAPSKLTQFWQIPGHNAFLSPVLVMFRDDCSIAVKPASTPWRLLPKQTWRDSLPIDILLSAASVLVVVLPSSEVAEILMDYPVILTRNCERVCILVTQRIFTLFSPWNVKVTNCIVTGITYSVNLV